MTKSRTMTPSTTRREFLLKSVKATISSAVLFGLESCRGGKDPEIRALTEALAAAKLQKKPCVIIKLPAAAEEKQQIGEALVAHAYDCDELEFSTAMNQLLPDFEIHQLFAEAVFVVLSAEEVNAARISMERGEMFIVVNDKGERERGTVATVADAVDRGRFKQIVGELLHGERNSILQKRAEASRRGLSADQSAAIDHYIHTAATPADFDKAAMAVRWHYNSNCPLAWQFEARPSSGVPITGPASNGPWLVLLNSKITSAEVAELNTAVASSVPYLINLQYEAKAPIEKLAIQILLEQYFMDLMNRWNGATGASPALGLPFNIERTEDVGCGNDSHGRDMGILCGTGFASPASRKFINYYRAPK